MRPTNDRRARLAVILAGSSWLLATAGATNVRAERPVDFDREIRPILSEHCYACHGPDQKARKAGLRLDRREDAFRDRGGYAPIVPAKVDESELIAHHVRRSRRDDAAAAVQETPGREADRAAASVGRGRGQVGGPLVAGAAGERADTERGGPILAAQPDRFVRARPAGGRKIAPDGRGRPGHPYPPRQPRPDGSAPDARGG